MVEGGREGGRERRVLTSQPPAVTVSVDLSRTETELELVMVTRTASQVLVGLMLVQQAVTLSLLCHFQPYINTLHCQCGQDGLSQLETRLRLDTFTNQLEVLQIQHCPHLVLLLDLVNVNASTVQVNFSQCNKVVIRGLIMETDYAGHQTLHLVFSSIQTVELRGLYLSDPVNIQFENVQTVNIADSSFVNMTEHNIQSFNSGEICVSNSFLSRSEDGDVISVCPWVAASSSSSLSDNNQIKPVKVSSSTPQNNDNLTKPRYELQDHVLVPLSIGITIVLLFSIIVSIFLVEKTLPNVLSRNVGKSSENNSNLKPESDRISFNSEGIYEKKEGNSVSNDPLRRSISAVLLFNKNNEIATLASVEHWLSQNQDEYLC